MLAAGVFGLQDLLFAQMAGGVAGALATDGLAGGAVGAGLGGLAAKKSYAESQGVTIQLILAVTAEQIHVLNRETDGRLTDVVASFDRASCEVSISKFGLSRIIDLTDPATGTHLKLTGTTAPFSMLAKPDKLVLHLLSA